MRMLLLLALLLAPVGASAARIESDAANSLTSEQKHEKVHLLAERAVECVAEHIASDPQASAEDFDLLNAVEVYRPKCGKYIQEMVTVSLRYFGKDATEQSFMDDFVRQLPHAVRAYFGSVGD